MTRREAPLAWCRWQQDLDAYALEEHCSVRSAALRTLVLPRLRCVALHRLAHHLWTHDHRAAAAAVKSLNSLLHGIDLDVGADIRGGLTIYHPTGVVIGEIVAGSGLRVGPGVCIGSGKPGYVGSLGQVRTRPLIGDNVFVGAHASVLGGVRIASEVSVGAHCLVTTSLGYQAKVRAPEAVAA